MKEHIVKLEEQTNDFYLNPIEVLFDMEVKTPEGYERKKLENIPSFKVGGAHLQAKVDKDFICKYGAGKKYINYYEVK